MLSLFLLLIFLGIFISGMLLLRSGLFNLSADSLQKWLVTFTDAPWKGLLTGAIVTAILQSSSAVTVITIGLISAGILTFRQSIGIILGTNIGTTITVEIIAIDIDSLIIPIAVVGGVLALMKNKNFRNSGYAILGLAAVFGGMWGFEYVAAPLKEMEVVYQILQSIDDNHFYGILVGTIITAIVQSSSAATGMVMGFLSAGSMELSTGVALALGANIGTCVTALFAALVSHGKAERLTAYAHIWVNVIGVAIFFPLIGLLATIGQQLATHPDVQLAHISVIFNVLTSLLFLPFANKFGNLLLKIHDREKEITS